MSCFFLVYFSRVSAGWPCAVPGVGVQDPLTCGRVPEQDPGGCSSLQGGAAMPCVREPTELLLSRRIRALGATKRVYPLQSWPCAGPSSWGRSPGLGLLQGWSPAPGSQHTKECLFYCFSTA